MQTSPGDLLPGDWNDHGVEGLICKPAGFVATVSYFISIYVACSFSLNSYPGGPYKERATKMVATLFYPSFGLLRAVNQTRCGYAGEVTTLLRRQDDLQQAQHAGAQA